MIICIKRPGRQMRKLLKFVVRKIALYAVLSIYHFVNFICFVVFILFSSIIYSMILDWQWNYLKADFQDLWHCKSNLLKFRYRLNCVNFACCFKLSNNFNKNIDSEIEFISFPFWFCFSVDIFPAHSSLSLENFVKRTSKVDLI